MPAFACLILVPGDADAYTRARLDKDDGASSRWAIFHR
jgi:hypothetical protein